MTERHHALPLSRRSALRAAAAGAVAAALPARSMLAQDVTPSRLDRAKTDLRDLVGVLDGDRIGLVAYAGAAQILCPLTFDYGFFVTLLEEANVGTVALGGTAIGDAIRKATTCFDDDIRNYKIILLITDGEETRGEDQDSFPEMAAQDARETLGVRIFCVGLVVLEFLNLRQQEGHLLLRRWRIIQ